jgi:hypothetical protein
MYFVRQSKNNNNLCNFTIIIIHIEFIDKQYF